ncbi:hypothetical protein JCM10213v2_005830 [Rhodosporidiobolus nylandii]
MLTTNRSGDRPVALWSIWDTNMQQRAQQQQAQSSGSGGNWGAGGGGQGGQQQWALAKGERSRRARSQAAEEVDGLLDEAEKGSREVEGEHERRVREKRREAARKMSMSDYATCGLVLVCIAMTGGAGIAVCILRGTCGLQLLAGPVMVLGTGATIYSTVDGAQPATNGTSTISDSQFRSLVVKVGVWYYLAIACYLGSVGLGIYIVCQDNPSAGRTPLTRRDGNDFV